MVISDYFINAYWWLFLVILLVAIVGFLLVVIFCYSIGGYF
jgi:hypothetical protein